MKRFILALTALITMTVSASAMSYQQARDQALFLTDKMAYELNLTDEQYEAAYEINLDYLMRIDTYDDLYGAYWRQRNMDLGYILLDWQYRAYCAASYFYRPLYWDGGYWHFGIYARYPHRDYFYFGCPDFFWSYRGGHSWHMNGGHSWYHGRSWAGPRDGGMNPGMRNRFDGGHFGQGYRYQASNRTWTGGPQQGNMRPQNNRNNMGGNNMGGNTGNRSFGNLNRGSQSNANSSNRTFGSPRQSSTRTTVTRPNNNGNGANTGNRTFGNRLNSNSSTPSRTFSPQGNSGRSFGSSSTGRSSASSMRSQSTPSTRSTAPSSPSRSFGSHSSSNGGGSHSGGNSGGGGGHFGRR